MTPQAKIFWNGQPIGRLLWHDRQWRIRPQAGPSAQGYRDMLRTILERQVELHPDWLKQHPERQDWPLVTSAEEPLLWLAMLPWNNRATYLHVQVEGIKPFGV